MTAIRLSDHVWLVGTADESSPAFTTGYDCNQYIFRAHGFVYAIDAGSGLGSEQWLANVREVARLEEIAGVLVTHYHGDHAGGAASAAAAGLRIMGSPETAEALARADEQVTQVARAREAGIYPNDFTLSPVGGVDRLPEVYELAGGAASLSVLAAPGHCDGHIVVLAEVGDERALFSGDVIFTGGRVSIQAIPDCRLDAYAETVQGLDELCIDQLYPGHGAALLNSAYTDIARAAASFRVLVPPPNLLDPPGYD